MQEVTQRADTAGIPPSASHLNGVGEGVANVQRARDVGRGDDDDERRLGAVHVGLEEAALLPPVFVRTMQRMIDWATV